MHNYLKAIINWVKILRKRKSREIGPQKKLISEFQLSQDIKFCHKDTVHIFVRGLADGKLHSAKNRNWSDFRFYKKDGLKVFCAVCRKRIL